MGTNLSIQDLANWFLSKEPISHKKLQKLCYYAIAWGWTLMNRPIVDDGDFQAWIHGPVSVALYTKYKNNGWSLLPKYTDKLAIPSDVIELLESVWVTYGDKDGNELEALSHIEQPWRNARVGVAENKRSSSLIKVNDMKKYYQSIYNGDDK